MKTVADLLAETSRFFSRHWNSAAMESAPPQWEPWEKFLFGPVPNHDKAGCYALFVGEELVYVGVGASRGGGIYPDHGLSRRLTGHVISADRSKGPEWSRLTEKWWDVTGIYTIGFPHEAAHLGASLEAYLIRALGMPSRNRRV